MISYKSLFIVAIIGTVVQCLVLNRVHECEHDSDCAPHQCCAEHLGDKLCESYQNASDFCHLPTHQHHTIIYRCGCAQGLICGTLVLDPSHHNHELGIVEGTLGGIGLGTCMTSPLT